MKLIFEKSRDGRGTGYLPASAVPACELPENLRRAVKPHLPQVAECDVERHYAALARRSFGVCSGFYPLGSCTMKYNPRIDEEIASWEAFSGIHPLQSERTSSGCREVLAAAEQYLCEITGMDAMSFQPAAGAHGEFTGLLLMKAWHQSRGDAGRTVILVPDSAHGTNPASAAMAGFTVRNIPSSGDGCVDINALRQAVGPDTAGLMLTNPNTLGLFDRGILEITRIVHDAGGLVYYDGANMNAIMGVTRPGDMGFDVIHINLHKTFSTPHGGGGPGSGPVGCKMFLKGFLPGSALLGNPPENSIGQVRAFLGNFAVVVRALCYILSLGVEGIREASENAVLNANYMMSALRGTLDIAYDRPCMHEFVLSLERLKKETGVSALDVAKGLLDSGIHPPTMYFPLIVHEALMIEPTETESRETMDEAVSALKTLAALAYTNPQALHDSPLTAPVRRPDEVKAARHPCIRADLKPQ
jgi:glycine dehydrogenase subunit 2